jgi:hypothetical protein
MKILKRLIIFLIHNILHEYLCKNKIVVIAQQKLNSK